MSRERITRFFDVSREMDPRASSGKILHVKSRYPESFRFLGLWYTHENISNRVFFQLCCATRWSFSYLGVYESINSSPCPTYGEVAMWLTVRNQLCRVSKKFPTTGLSDLLLHQKLALPLQCNCNWQNLSTKCTFRLNSTFFISDRWQKPTKENPQKNPLFQELMNI